MYVISTCSKLAVLLISSSLLSTPLQEAMLPLKFNTRRTNIKYYIDCTDIRLRTSKYQKLYFRPSCKYIFSTDTAFCT